MNALALSSIQPAALGTRAFRIVLRALPDNSCTPYVVHMETDPNTDKAGFHNGDYCADLLQAFNVYVKRCARTGVTALDAQGKRITSLAPDSREH